MKKEFKNIRLQILAAAIFFTLLTIGHQTLINPADAQTPNQTIITWQAKNFYPADYPGKALATPGTPITSSVEVIRGGRLADLSEATILWYIDEKLEARDEGLKEIVFNVEKTVGDSHFVRVSIQSGENVFESSIRIPVSNPKVVLKTPYPNKLVKAGEKPEITAIPYFFNINSFQSLNFFWQIDRGIIRESGNDNRLILNTGGAQSERIIQVAGTAQNKNNPLETATSRTELVTY